MAAAIPVVRVVGPGRNVGKTWLATHLVAELVARGYEVGAVKRSHHPVPEDRAGSDTDRFASAGATTVAYGASDGTLTRSAAVSDVSALLPAFGASVDLVVVEGFRTDTLGAVLEIEPGLTTLAHLRTMDGCSVASNPIDDVRAIATALECTLALSPLGDARTRGAIRAAALQHGHRCPGITLGVRMALHALDVLGVAREASAARSLMVEVETARCATDAIVAVSGCTPGSGRLTLREIGKLAATFTLGPRAVRVTARPGLAAFVGTPCCGNDLHAQDATYRALDTDELLRTREFEVASPRPIRPHTPRVTCTYCGEEMRTNYASSTAIGLVCADCVGRVPDALSAAHGSVL